MFFSWFDAKEAEEFGILLATSFIERVPKEVLTSQKKGKPFQKMESVLTKMSLEIVQFRTSNRLNVYKKAKLGNAFKWELKNAGYEPSMIEDLTNFLITRL